MTRPTADVVVVNWNARELVGQCLDSLRRHPAGIGRVIVVDNGSTDGSVEALRAHDGIVLVANPANHGFARACNQGAAHADARYILFLNPDARLIDESFPHLLDFMESPAAAGIGICGARLVGDDGETQPSCANFTNASTYVGQAIGLGTRAPRLFTPLFAQIDYHRSQIVDQAIGAFFVVRTDLYRSLGGMDERFFVYFEEVDFSLRAKQAGWDSYFFADAAAYHKGGGVSERVKAARLFYTLRSRLLYARKHFSRAQFAMTLAVTLAVEPFGRLARAVLRRSGGEAADTLRAYRALLRDAPAIRATMRELSGR